MFHKGDILEILATSETGWWLGRKFHNEEFSSHAEGLLFPLNYVQLLYKISS